MTKKTRTMTIAGLVCAASITSAGASLIGDEFTANLLLGGAVVNSITETALDGPEATGNWLGLLGYDVQGDTITVFSLVEDPATMWNSGLDFQFLDLNFASGLDIIGAEIIATGGDGFSSILDSDLSWTSDSLTIDGEAITGHSARHAQTITIRLNTVPAPGVLSLLGVAAIPMMRRRR